MGREWERRDGGEGVGKEEWWGGREWERRDGGEGGSREGMEAIEADNAVERRRREGMACSNLVPQTSTYCPATK